MTDVGAVGDIVEAHELIDPTAAIKRVRTASDQVATQLREMILSGALPNGARLPTELELARRSGVSRATIREALQVLATEGLTRTRKGGVNGGTFVTVPSPDQVMHTLRSGVTMLSNNDGVTLQNLLEMRELLEVPAAGLAAERRTEEDFARLREAACFVPGRTGSGALHTASFHVLVINAAHNPLLSISAQPVQHVLLADRFTHDAFGPRLRAEINGHHGEIADAIARQDAPAARRLMQEHLRWLRPRHERFLREQRLNRAS
jgi:DNA-binding FadR family transcriptional regulator